MLTMWLDDTGQEALLDTVSRFIIPGSVFLLTLVSGVWLSCSGKPLNTGIFTVHKLIALGAVVATAIRTSKRAGRKFADLGYVMLVLLPLTFLAGFAYDSERVSVV
jgi:hypothetical protein